MERWLWALNATGVGFIAAGVVLDIVVMCWIVWQVVLFGRSASHVPFVAPALYVIGCFMAQTWMSPVASMIGLCLIIFHAVTTILLPYLVGVVRRMVL
jgi:hypothetical protein